MKIHLMTQVTDAIFEVMETMFFLTLEKAKEPQTPPLSDTMLETAAITFSGEFSGTIYLSIPTPLLQTMTENFMGEDISNLSRDHVEGTLKEALNMVAGSALTKLDSTVYMGLGIPEIVSPPAPEQIDASVLLSSSQDTLAAHVKMNG